MHNYTQSRLSFLKRRTVVAVLGAFSIPALAQNAVILPAQQLGDSLSSLARQSNVDILAPENLVAGHSAPSVSGQLSVDETLNRLLAGSGLVYQRKDDRTFVIKPEAEKQGVQVLPEINVNDAQNTTGGGLIATSTSTATKSDTPIGQTPQNVRVITQTAIRDQGVQSVTEALQNVSGVVVQATNPGAPVVYIRGMRASTLSNGGNDNSNDNSLNVPIAGIEQVEVIKGADAILTGLMNPGGVVNVVRKQPTATPVRELTVQVGSYGDLLSSIDLGGPLTSDERLTYRFVLSGERSSETFGGYNGTRNLYISPSIGWKSDGTEVTLQYSHNVNHQVPLAMTVVEPDGGPVKFTGRSENLSTTLSQDDQVQFNLKQKLVGDLDFIDKTTYDKRINSVSNDNDFPYELESPDSTFYLIGGQRSRTYSVDTDNHFQYKLNTGDLRQTFTAGVDYNVVWLDSWSGSGGVLAPFPTADIPGYFGPYRYRNSGKSYLNTFYVQDQASWGRLHVVAGMARSNYWDDGDNSQSKWLPSIGALYQLTDSVAIYGNDLQSFEPQYDELADGSISPPETGHSIEAGVKVSLFNDDLSIDASAYRTSLKNQASYDYSTGFYEVNGQQVTRGFDVSVTGKLAKGLRVLSSYTFANPQAPSATIGAPPRHSGSMWVFYDLPGETLHGLGGGVGVVASTKSQYVSGSTTYTVPGQAQTNLTVYYKAKKWSATLAVKNLFNRTLYEPGASSFAVLQPGRLVYLTGRYDF